MITGFSEATGIQRSAVIGLVVVLLVFSAFVNIGGQLLVRRRRRRDESHAGPDDILTEAEPETVPA